MKLRDIPEVLAFLPANVNLDADINDSILHQHAMDLPLLHWACKNNMTDLIEMLVTNCEKYGLNINALDTDNNPALAYTTDCSVMQMFIEAGADLTIRFRQGLEYGEWGRPLSPFPIDKLLPILKRTDNAEFSNIKGVLSAIYDRHFYEQYKTKLAITFTKTATASLGSDILYLISEYAFGLSNDITERKAVHELASLRSMCKRAYDTCKKDQFLDTLYNAVGTSGLNNLVALANLVGENGIVKLAALLKQPTPSACPEQNANAHPAVLAFSAASRQTTATTATSSSTITATIAKSSSSSNSNLQNRLNPRDNHPRWGQFKRK